MEIKQITDRKNAPMDLLLLADPNRQMVEKYLVDGHCYGANERGSLVGVYVLIKKSSTKAEIANIAVHPDRQNEGIGRKLIEHAIAEAKSLGFELIEVGTGNSSIGQLALYQKCGFHMQSIIKDFFTNHYDEKIEENGIICRDMIRLSKQLT
ncbi:GNAT family N-acetyltransferase [Sediminibacillus dalangtanensis]|uniref:GNAT family N-acetyltransferase n=1 Tax=Sediminibacillus dalangtanensis TaxID=2729421 RepID=A0ABX7VMP6_9BACI|nr:GNAT family N-acetyltransferase [Sediminibacillus dalangtanensis]QTM98084.1 GNAT family N-acetyltransferase [Sediminibacillus dalangtanensis]